MTEEKKSGAGAAVLKKFFGTLPGQKLADFAAELKSLSEKDKDQIKKGLEDGSLTY